MEMDETTTTTTTPVRNPPVRSSRLSRSTNACQRCRRRKQRCDLRRPKCSSCDAANVPCLSYDTEKKAEIPRDYVASLEAQVRQLKAELEQQKRRGQGSIGGRSPGSTPRNDGQSMEITFPASPAATNNVSTDLHEVVKSMGVVMLESSNHPRFVGSSSGITFARMVLAAIKTDDIPVADLPGHPGTGNPDQAASSLTSSLPPQQNAMHVLDVYFQYRTSPHVILSRSKVDEAVRRIYNDAERVSEDVGSPTDHDFFLLFMTLAVGYYSVRPAQSEGCFNSALRCLDKVLTYSPSSLETLTIVLLLCQYVALSPSRGSLWQLTGLALRLSIDLGLHWETEGVLSMPAEVLQEMRRLFWAAYQFDRFLCVTLGRPFGIADLSLNTSFPDAASVESSSVGTDRARFDVHNQRASNHMSALHRLRAEIKHVLYHQLTSATLGYPRANYPLWFRNIVPRVTAWREEAPDTTQAHPESLWSRSEWWDAHFYDAMLLLHRPNPRVPHPTAESMQVCFESACKSVRAIKSLQRQGKTCVAWQWGHHIFLAGLTMIYSLWQSQSVRDTAPLLDVMGAVQDCSSTLTALTEHFPQVRGCRDAFEGLSAATMKWLVKKDGDEVVASDAQQQQVQQATWESELNAMRAQMGLSSSFNSGWPVDDFAGYCPDETFEVAEFLNAASQWPSNLGDVTGQPDLSGGMQDIFGNELGDMF